MNNIDESVNYFWEESLLQEEKKAVQAAGFSNPVDFFDIPYVGLSLIAGLNCEIARDVLFGIATYMTIPDDGYYDPAGRIDKYLLDLHYSPSEAVMNRSERNYLNVDEMLYEAGYNGEETARMTVRQMLNLTHITMETLEALADIVRLAYISRYREPEKNYENRMDLLKGKRSLFGNRRTEYDG